MPTHQPGQKPARAWWASLLLALAAGCTHPPQATRPAAASPAAKPAAPAEPVEARAILLRMARYLAALPRFSVRLAAQYDAVQASGRQIEFGERLSIDVRRPTGLRVEAVTSHGDRQWLFYDGQTLTTFHPETNVYAQAAKPGDNDAAIRYFLNDLQMKLPLAALLMRQFPDEVGQRSQVVDYVENTGLYGAPAHHLAGQTEALDYEVWVAEGAQPLPQRIVLTYRNAPGQPAFRAQFSNWNLAPEPVDFSFSPPPGARKIAFAAQLPQTALPVRATAKATGGSP